MGWWVVRGVVAGGVGWWGVRVVVGDVWGGGGAWGGGGVRGVVGGAWGGGGVRGVVGGCVGWWGICGVVRGVVGGGAQFPKQAAGGWTSSTYISTGQARTHRRTDIRRRAHVRPHTQTGTHKHTRPVGSKHV